MTITLSDHNTLIISNNIIDIITCNEMTEGDVPPFVNTIATVEMGVRNLVDVLMYYWGMKGDCLLDT